MIAMTSPRPPVNPTEARFIRLGPGSSWAKTCFDTGTIRFGVTGEPHDLCLKSDWKGVEQALAASGMRSQTASQLKGQLFDFYSFGSDCLWITATDGRLWWGFAEPEVTDLRGSGDDMGVVTRRMREGWSCTTIDGNELIITELGSAAVVTRYSGALCTVRELDLVCNAINGR